MTTWTLLALILAGMTVQAAILLAAAFHRHWQRYQALQESSGERQAGSGPAAEPKYPGWRGFRRFRVASSEPEDDAGLVRALDLVPDDDTPVPTHAPGQFLTLRLRVPDPATGDTETVTRCYTISRGPGRAVDGRAYRVSVKRLPPPPEAPDVPPGRASNHIHDRLSPGDVIEAAAPQGHFTLDPQSDEPVVLIGGGVGVTPMLAMLEAILDNNPAREVWLIHAARTPTEFVRRQELRALEQHTPNLKVILVAEKPGPRDNPERECDEMGRVDIRFLRLTLPLRLFQFYVCGPRPMMEALIPDLLSWGVPKSHIHFEAFGPASLPAELLTDETDSDTASESNPHRVSVTFARSARTVSYDGARSLLDLAERNGIRVEAVCRAGCCGACQTRIREGDAEHTRAPDVRPAPGHVLLCLGWPRTDLVLDA